VARGGYSQRSLLEVSVSSVSPKIESWTPRTQDPSPLTKLGVLGKRRLAHVARRASVPCPRHYKWRPDALEPNRIINQGISSAGAERRIKRVNGPRFRVPQDGADRHSQFGGPGCDRMWLDLSGRHIYIVQRRLTASCSVVPNLPCHSTFYNLGAWQEVVK
jgi:hypothetical protein